MKSKALKTKTSQLIKIDRLLRLAAEYGSLKSNRYMLGIFLGIFLGFILLVALGLTRRADDYVYLPLIACIAIAYWMNNFSHLPKTWTEKIDAELNQYDPIDKDAYRHLQDEIKGQNRPLFDCFEAWLEKERSAVLESQPRPVPSLKFLQKQV